MLFTILVCTFTFSSCSSDSDDEPPIQEDEISESDFVGYWKEKSSDPDPYFIILNADGSGSEVEIFHSEVESYSFKWEFRNGDLIIDYLEDNERIVNEVVSLSKSTMVVKNEDGDKITFTRVKASDVPEQETTKVAVAGKWRGSVYEAGTCDNDWITIELGNDLSYKEYDDGKLIASGKYSYSGNTITIPSKCAIAYDWGNRFQVTISGNSMKWTSSEMTKWNCEYRFDKQ